MPRAAAGWPPLADVPARPLLPCYSHWPPAIPLPRPSPHPRSARGASSLHHAAASGCCLAALATHHRRGHRLKAVPGGCHGRQRSDCGHAHNKQHRRSNLGLGLGLGCGCDHTCADECGDRGRCHEERLSGSFCGLLGHWRRHHGRQPRAALLAGRGSTPGGHPLPCRAALGRNPGRCGPRFSVTVNALPASHPRSQHCSVPPSACVFDPFHPRYDRHGGASAIALRAGMRVVVTPIGMCSAQPNHRAPLYVG
mmetsp:Transcript_83739/g.211146  ORF Transcript_83739/g.211146 Transcript_83739/m.211146 type:complete len:253 (-) Transcript_83739:682-1440(-)